MSTVFGGDERKTWTWIRTEMCRGLGVRNGTLMACFWLVVNRKNLKRWKNASMAGTDTYIVVFLI